MAGNIVDSSTLDYKTYAALSRIESFPKAHKTVEDAASALLEFGFSEEQAASGLKALYDIFCGHKGEYWIHGNGDVYSGRFLDQKVDFTYFHANHMPIDLPLPVQAHKEDGNLYLKVGDNAMYKVSFLHTSAHLEPC